MKKKILITGGAGFIGYHVTKELLINPSVMVICMDNLHSGYLSNIQDYLPNSRYRFIEWDIVEPFDVDCDEIYHLACPASPAYYQKDPLQVMKTNVIGTLNVLEVARKNNAKLLFTSTSEVYGDPEMHPQREEYWGNVNPTGVRACYVEGKRAAESLVSDYVRVYDLDIKVARLFNTYGPMMGDSDGRVISNFIDQVSKGKPLTIYGSGNQTRSFCYVGDLVWGLMLLMEKKERLGPINLGNTEEIRIMDLAKMIFKLTDSRENFRFLPLPTDDPKRRRPSTEKAFINLGWKPKVSLEEGLGLTIDARRLLVKEKSV